MLALGAIPTTTRAAEKSPVLNIESALKIAQDYLKGATPSDPRYLVALTLERPALAGGAFWYARWSSPIIGAGKPEIGLRIGMDGSLTKVVAGAGGGGSGSVTWGAQGPSVPIPGVGSQKYGVRDMH
jgi:hypothetical protein